MALVNYSLPFGAPSPASWSTISPIHASPHAVNNLYEPTGHQQNVLHNEDYYKNGPYRHQQPQQQPQQQLNSNARNYLPPHQAQNNNNNPNNNRNGYNTQTTRTRTYGESSYSQQAPTSFSSMQNNNGYYNNGQSFKENPYQTQQKQPQPLTTKPPNSRSTVSYQSNTNTNSNNNYNLNRAGYPEQPPGFKPIQAGQGSRTQNGELRNNF